MPQKTSPSQLRPRPWATAAVAALAVASLASATLGEALIYRRSQILDGQLWRIWSGHIVHHGWNHLLWDLAVFVATGAWLERLNPRAARWLCAFAPMAISVMLFVFDPQLQRYAGLSGLASGTLAALACTQLRRRQPPRVAWWGLLALLAAKLLIELRATAPLFAAAGEGVRNVPLAHGVGALAGIVVACLVPRKIGTPPANGQAKSGSPAT